MPRIVQRYVEKASWNGEDLEFRGYVLINGWNTETKLPEVYVCTSGYVRLTTANSYVVVNSVKSSRRMSTTELWHEFNQAKDKKLVPLGVSQDWYSTIAPTVKHFINWMVTQVGPIQTNNLNFIPNYPLYENRVQVLGLDMVLSDKGKLKIIEANCDPAIKKRAGLIGTESDIMYSAMFRKFYEKISLKTGKRYVPQFELHKSKEAFIKLPL